MQELREVQPGITAIFDCCGRKSGVGKSETLRTLSFLSDFSQSEFSDRLSCMSGSEFLTGRYDIIRVSIAYQNAPVVLVGTHAGLAIGKDGVTQMGLEDVSIMRALPNMVVLNPASYSEAIKVIEYLCDTELESPHYLRLGRQPVEDIEIDFEFGKGQIVNDGDDITLFSTGCILSDVIEASNIIEKNTSYSVRVVNITTLKPIDEEIIISERL